MFKSFFGRKHGVIYLQKHDLHATLYFFCGTCGLFGELTNLVGDNGEASSGISGSRSLDFGI